MHALAALSLPAFAVYVVAQSEVGAWGQCGGLSYTGATDCTSGYFCSTQNEYYAQCTPGTATATTTSTAGVTTSGNGGTTTAPPTTTTGTVASNTAGVPTTLVSPWIWIRAVESPNYHSYLQAQPTLSAGLAYLDDYTTAGQFQIEDGQVVMNTGTLPALYMNIEDPANKSTRAIHAYFNTTKNTYGTFAWSGDALQWTDPDVDRPNLSAWYVCEDQELYINTGAYDYDDPSGCSDETIHYYNGATACGSSC